ncbi:MAG: hypothetical protein ACREJ2_17485, partial [Planctomycetota bacterium]
AGGATPGATPAAAPAPCALWDTLPENTWFEISFPNTVHLQKAFAAGKLHALGQLPGFHEFLNDLQDFYAKRITGGIANASAAPYLKTLHIDSDLPFTVAQGEVTFAIVQFDPTPGAANYDVILKAQTAKPEQASGFSDLVDMILTLRPDLQDAVQKTVVKYGAKSANELAVNVPGVDLGLYYSTGDSTLLIGTNGDRFGAALQGQPAVSDKETALRDGPLVKSVEKALHGAPDFFVMINPAAVPEKLTDNNPGLKQFFGGLKSIGVQKFAYALRVDDGTGNVLETVAVKFDPATWKDGAAVTQPIDLSTFERGAGGVLAQAGVNLNWNELWNRLKAQLNAGPDQGAGDRVEAGFEQAFGQKLPEVLSSLQGNLSASVSLPRNATGFAANVLPDLSVAAAIKDPAPLTAVLTKFNALLAARPRPAGNPPLTVEAIQIAGAKSAWRYDAHDRRFPFKPVIAVFDGKVVAAPLLPMLERSQRMTPYGPQLAACADWQQLKGEVDPQAFFVGYLDLPAAAELGYNLGVTLAALAPVDPFAKYRLPAGDAIGTSLNGWLVQAYTDHDVLVVQSHSPVGFVPGLALTGLIGTYFRDQEQQQLELVRRDMASQRLTALYHAVTKYKQDTGKLPAKLSDLYPDYLKNIADFTAGDQAWS